MVLRFIEFYIEIDAMWRHLPKSVYNRTRTTYCEMNSFTSWDISCFPELCVCFFFSLSIYFHDGIFSLWRFAQKFISLSLTFGVIRNRRILFCSTTSCILCFFYYNYNKRLPHKRDRV